MIRSYGDLPALFVPDEGEVVLASRSPAGPFLRAVIIRVRRASRGKVRVDFEWLESYPTSPKTGAGHWAGEKGNVYISEQDKIPLIRRVPRD